MCMYIYIEINHYRQYVKDLLATRGNPQASMITSSFVKTDQMQIFPQEDRGWLRVAISDLPIENLGFNEPNIEKLFLPNQNFGNGDFNQPKIQNYI